MEPGQGTGRLGGSLRSCPSHLSPPTLTIPWRQAAGGRHPSCPTPNGTPEPTSDCWASETSVG